MVFHQILCGILANKIINKIIKSVFRLQIQIYIKHPPPPPTKVKGKVQQLFTQYSTFRPQILSAAFDLAPQTETTTVCLAFCVNPSSMRPGPVHLLQWNELIILKSMFTLYTVHQLLTFIFIFKICSYWYYCTFKTEYNFK